ncbi:unnamed protein product [Mytilus edulis]|uniref:Uncharacterized protein n=1 Tax=Mytilus edulis TaxID=6550 RepID=A0A8S3SVG0_MYTED|nr:unnamed protein product [Mytilus edulis]
MDSRFSATQGNLLKWPYESQPGDHEYTVDCITNSSWPAKHMPHLFHINQHISHLETQSGQMLHTHGLQRTSFLQTLFSKENARKGKHRDVKIYIQTLFEMTVKLLQKTYSVFQNSELSLAGSMGEQTKVDRPDEFDFVIILPQLSEIDVFWPDRMRKNKHIREYAKDFNFDTRTHLQMISDLESMNCYWHLW